MIHTMTITYRIESIRTYNEVFKSLKDISESNSKAFYPEQSEYITHAMKEKGFQRIALMRKMVSSKYKYPYMQLSITLNPATLIGKGYEEIMENTDIDEVKRVFDNEVLSIHRELPRLVNWTVNRIDYAVNIETEYVKEYIRLFQRGDKPYNYKEPYDKRSKRRKQLEGSLYLISEGVNINFYDKGDERKKAGVEGINNLLRLEVQCKKNKVNSIKKSKKIDLCLVGNFLDPLLSQKIINYYFKKVIGNGNYLTLAEAIRTIKNSSYGKKTKNKCIDVLKQINEQRSIWKARQKSNYEKNEFNRHLKYIQALGVNPVTIPVKWNIEKLESLLVVN